jgi:hypothetical protein
MLTQDNIFEIALNANFKTTINMIKAFKFLDGVWKMKINIDAKYFEFWSGCQNYLIHCKKMCLNVNFGNHSFVDHYLYEYNPMLQNILNTGNENDLNTIITINNLKQFIVLYENDIDYIITILGKYNTKNDALNAIDDKRELLSPYEHEVGSYFRAVIINLEYMIPFFIKYIPAELGLTVAHRVKNYTFYHCYKYKIV